MSRSYKRTPYNGDNKGKAKKRIANKKLRMKMRNHEYELAKGGAFRKAIESYDICDFYTLCTWEQYWAICIRCWERYGGEKPNKKIEYRNWLKYYRSK